MSTELPKTSGEAVASSELVRRLCLGAIRNLRAYHRWHPESKNPQAYCVRVGGAKLARQILRKLKDNDCPKKGTPADQWVSNQSEAKLANAAGELRLPDTDERKETK